MAAPTYATDLNDIFLDGGGTGWTTVGGGRTTDPETDDFIQGSSCWSHDPFSSGIEGGVYPSSQTITAGDVIFYWIRCDVAQTLATKANGGMQCLVGNSATALKCYYVRGSDDYEYGGWICVPVDPTLTQSASIGTPTAVTSWFGARWNVPASGASKGYPMKVDAMRHGRGEMRVAAGDGTTPGTFTGMAAANDASTARWGLFQAIEGGYKHKGLMILGYAAAVYFDDVNKSIVIDDVEWVSSAFNAIEIRNVSSDVTWTSVQISSLCAVSPGSFKVVDNCSVLLDGCRFSDMSTFVLKSNTDALGCQWVRCSNITPNGAVLTGSVVEDYQGATNTSALWWSDATDPDGNLDDMTFIKGAATTHAISFGVSSPLTMTLRGVDFQDYNATDGSNDSALYVARTSGTVTINLVGCTGDISYKSAGATVVLVTDPVTVTVTALDIDTDLPVQTAEILVYAADGTGDLPYQDSVTITRSVSTATVTHTAHGLTTGKKVLIKGADQNDYNGVKVITVTGPNAYTYTVSNSPTTPATGTIVSTGVVIAANADVNGEATDTRSYSLAQPVTGRARSATSPGPYYKTQKIAGTISTTAGLDTTVLMIGDE